MPIKFLDQQENNVDNQVEVKKSRIKFIDSQSLTPGGLSQLSEPTGPTVPPQELPFFSVSRQDVSNVARPLIEGGSGAAGTVLGAIGGGAAVPGAGAIPGSVIGGATGLALGSTLADKLDEFIGVKRPPQNIGQAVGETLGSVEKGIRGEILGSALGATAGTLFKAGGKAISYAPNVARKTVEEVTDMAKSVGIDLTPFEITGSKALGKIESILDSLPWSSGIIQKFRLGQLEQFVAKRNELIEKNGSNEAIETLGRRIQSRVDDFLHAQTNLSKENLDSIKTRLINKLGSRETYDDLGVAAINAKERYFQDLSNTTTRLYENVAKKVDDIGGSTIEPVNTIQAAKQAIKDLELVSPSIRDQNAINVLRGISEVSEQSPNLNKTYSQLNADRKAFVDLEAQHTDFLKNNQKDQQGLIFSRMKDATQQDMDALAKASGNSDVIEAHELAKISYKRKQDFLKDPAVKIIAQRNPSAIVTSIFNSGDTTLINKYKDVVGENLFNKSKDRLTSDILGIGKDKEISGDLIRSSIINLGDSAKVIYSPRELINFRRYADFIDGKVSATKEIFDNPIFKSIVKENTMGPSVARLIVKPKSVANIELIRRHFGEQGVKEVGDAFFNDLFATGQNGVFSPRLFANKFNQYGKETIQALYGKSAADDLEKLAISGRLAGGAERVSGNPSGTAGSLITFQSLGNLYNQAITAAAAIGGFGANAGNVGSAILGLGSAGSMLIGPRILAKMYLNPGSRKLFIEGLKLPAQSKEAGVLAAKILGYINTYNRDTNKKNGQ